MLPERFRTEYNTEHLHSSLGYMTPEEYAAAHPVGAARERYATMPSTGDTDPSAGTRDGGIPQATPYLLSCSPYSCSQPHDALTMSAKEAAVKTDDECPVFTQG